MFDFFDRARHCRIEARLERIEAQLGRATGKLESTLRGVNAIRDILKPRRAVSVVFGNPSLEPAPKPKE